jgi:hypothetical protein
MGLRRGWEIDGGLVNFAVCDDKLVPCVIERWCAEVRVWISGKKVLGLFAFLRALKGRIRAKEGGRDGMYALGPDSKSEAFSEGLRGVFEDRQQLGASADVFGVWPCRMLRFVSA